MQRERFFTVGRAEIASERFGRRLVPGLAAAAAPDTWVRIAAMALWAASAGRLAREPHSDPYGFPGRGPR